jgi:hypothetical protein
MRFAPFILDDTLPTARQYYSPRHYKSLYSFDMNPGDSLLVSLPAHESLEQVTHRALTLHRNVTSRYQHKDKLGIIVSYRLPKTTIGQVVRVEMNTYLNHVLALPAMYSRFVVITAGGKIKLHSSTPKKNPGQKKTKKVKCSCCCRHQRRPDSTPPTVITSIASYSAMQKQQQQQQQQQQQEEDSFSDTCEHVDFNDDDDIITLR